MAEQPEDLEPDPDREERRSRFAVAADQGIDQLAAVVDEQIRGLGDEFESRVNRVLTDALGEGGPTTVPPRQFITGALFGAVVLACGVFLGSLRRP